MINLENKFKSAYKELCLISLFYVKDIKEAEDIVQDIFVKILERENQDDIINLNYYLKKAVKNASLKRISQNNKLQLLDENALFYNEASTFDENEHALNKKVQLYKQIDGLPKQCKKIFLLCVLDDLKYQEAANQLGISINTVKTQMKKAFKTLRKELKDTYLLIFVSK
ncbi:sigma-70 family RNA polymerase sigma factor [Algibacter miyuki]|uniref:Sigma-70 family RNA polymerase sigma factor n=1 Tax=Algibacter miyuki TaxID=1306933 RepID=A0ABV5H0R3_9FLAO|nr:sigma-70 family RNA polymerase sigma factor [Algibacter miyuki]MDN3667579.1 sigma-70 family RNA polymerase sigma factor [Algibacter miyuki]